MTLRADLSGQVAVVAGASSGIGRHFCSVLRANGTQVVAAARRLDCLRELAEGDSGIVGQQCDVTEPDDVAVLMEQAGHCGGPDILVNAAGFGDATPALETSVEDFRHTVEVDLTATFQVSVAAAKGMPEGGSIINIASLLGLVGSWPVTQAAYCAAKGGVVHALVRTRTSMALLLDHRFNSRSRAC